MIVRMRRSQGERGYRLRCSLLKIKDIHISAILQDEHIVAPDFKALLRSRLPFFLYKFIALDILLRLHIKLSQSDCRQNNGRSQ